MGKRYEKKAKKAKALSLYLHLKELRKNNIFKSILLNQDAFFVTL